MHHFRDIVHPPLSVILSVHHIHIKINILITAGQILHKGRRHTLTGRALVIVKIQYRIILLTFRKPDIIPCRVLHRQHRCAHPYQRTPVGICEKPHLQTCLLVRKLILTVKEIIVRHIYCNLIIAHYPGLPIIPIYIIRYLRYLLVTLTRHDESVSLADNLIRQKTVKHTHNHIDVLLSHWFSGGQSICLPERINRRH